MIDLPNLSIDYAGADADELVSLEQEYGGTRYMITLHPYQVKLLAERLGLMRPDPEAACTIARLHEQMRLLGARVDELYTMLLMVAERGHECLDEEIAYSRATVDIAQAFIDDLGRHAVAERQKENMTASAAPTPNAERQRRYRERRKAEKRDALRRGDSDASVTRDVTHPGNGDSIAAAASSPALAQRTLLAATT